jgi:hypothetical protein
MEVKDLIAIISVLIAFVAFAVQQWRVWRLEQKKEYRTENKLRLLYLCQTDSLTKGQIVESYKQQHPLRALDEAEISKAIYEMLAEGTLVFIADNRTYEVRSHTARKPSGVAADLLASENRRIVQMVQHQQ